VAGAFTATAEGVRPERWSAPSPCEGWVARDVVAHLVEWVPPFLRAGAGVAIVPTPSVAEDPVAAWRSLADAIQALLDDVEVTGRRFEHPRAGSHALDAAISTFVCADVLVHTWDLATATGQDVVLDPEAVDAYLDQFAAVDEAVLVASGQFGPRVPVADGADAQTRLLALSGRRP
jgi:uncharacterized protein (TIGR03086 family)